METCRALLAAGASPAAQRAPYNFTPLHEAAYSLHADIAEVLVQAPAASLNALDALGRSPVAVAAEKRWAAMRIVKLLKRHGGRHIAPRSQTRGFHSLLFAVG